MQVCLREHAALALCPGLKCSSGTSSPRRLQEQPTQNADLSQDFSTLLGCNSDCGSQWTRRTTGWRPAPKGANGSKACRRKPASGRRTNSTQSRTYPLGQAASSFRRFREQTRRTVPLAESSHRSIAAILLVAACGLRHRYGSEARPMPSRFVRRGPRSSKG